MAALKSRIRVEYQGGYFTKDKPEYCPAKMKLTDPHGNVTVINCYGVKLHPGDEGYVYKAHREEVFK